MSVDCLESAIDVFAEVGDVLAKLGDVLAKVGELTLGGAALDGLEDDPELGTKLLQEDVGRFAPEARGWADCRGLVVRRGGVTESSVARELRRGNGARRVRTRGEDRRWACSAEEQRSCRDRVVENPHEERAVPRPRQAPARPGIGA